MIRIFGILILLLSNALSASSDDVAQATTVDVRFIIGDLYFVEEALKTVEITARETDAYLYVIDKLKLVTENEQVKNSPKEVAVMVGVEQVFTVNCNYFLNKAKFTGENAIRFKRVVSLLKDAEEQFKKKQSPVQSK